MIRTGVSVETAARMIGTVVLCGVFAACATADSEQTDGTAVAAVVVCDEWNEYFLERDVVGTFVLRQLGSTTTEVSDLDRAERRRIPASTFKILNSMIILETGIVADVDETVAWDGVVRDVPTWNTDQSLRTGIEVSAVWLYQELARRVGDQPMSELVAASGYGNAETGGGIDQFWLDGDLRISPLEQVDFLTRMEAGELPFRPGVVEEVRDILVREQGDEWTWSHKTGTAADEQGGVGWLVGTTQRGDRSWAFALAMELGAGDNGDRADRIDIARAILQAEGALAR